MLEQQFIQFTKSIDPSEKEMPIPICSAGAGFYVAESEDENIAYRLDAATPNGKIIQKQVGTIRGIYALIGNLTQVVAPDECFRLMLLQEKGDIEDYNQMVEFNVAPEDAPFTGKTLMDAKLAAGTYHLSTRGIVIEEFDVKGEHYAYPTIYAFKIVADGVTLATSPYISEGVAEDMEVDFTIGQISRIQIVITDFAAYNGYSYIQASSGTVIITHNEVETIGYSNLLRYMLNDDAYLSVLSYWCNEPQFGIPFSQYTHSTRPIIMRNGNEIITIPIRLSAAQYTQSDKIYETRNGDQIVLYATINKEYEGETDYIPEAWHEKIVTALSCDEVYINGERVTKSDSYEIDQENYTYADCGIRLTRATFKVKTNVVKRNSNC